MIRNKDYLLVTHPTVLVQKWASSNVAGVRWRSSPLNPPSRSLRAASAKGAFPWLGSIAASDTGKSIYIIADK